MPHLDSVTWPAEAELPTRWRPGRQEQTTLETYYTIDAIRRDNTGALAERVPLVTLSGPMATERTVGGIAAQLAERMVDVEFIVARVTVVHQRKTTAHVTSTAPVGS